MRNWAPYELWQPPVWFIPLNSNYLEKVVLRKSNIYVCHRRKSFQSLPQNRCSFPVDRAIPPDPTRFAFQLRLLAYIFLPVKWEFWPENWKLRQVRRPVPEFVVFFNKTINSIPQARSHRRRMWLTGIHVPATQTHTSRQEKWYNGVYY